MMSEAASSYITRQSLKANDDSDLLESDTAVPSKRYPPTISVQSSNAFDSSKKSQQFFIDRDGTTNNGFRDAAGQNCIYVISGDHRNEYYRLATFAKFPIETTPVSPGDMASSGFYFTGYKDRVKCFSCGITVEDWVIGDDALDPKWHKSICGMTSGSETRNIALPFPNYRTILRELLGKKIVFNPRQINSSITTQGSNLRDVTTDLRRIRLGEGESFPILVLANIVDPEFEQKLRATDLKIEFERRKTFEKFPSYPAPHLVSDLAKDGFFYLGNLDRTQCFSCSGVLRNWGANDSVREQHSRHFANCRMVKGYECGNIPMDDNQRAEMDVELNEKLNNLIVNNGEPPDPSPEEQRHLARYLPCNDAVNPHMSSLQTRINTFDINWPRSRINASIEQIAKAGFYYLGQNDKTKCFYCNGGLQNWDPNDEPWTEHAKWFPECEFVIRHKGPAFVRALYEAHPNLNRPFIRNPVSYSSVPTFVPGRSSPSMEFQQSIPVEIITPTVDINQVINMGFTQEMIDQANERRSDVGGFSSTEELIQFLLDYQHELTPRPHSTPQEGASGVGPAGSKRSIPHESEDTAHKKTRVSKNELTAEEKEMSESLREMQEMSLCRSCKRNKAEIALTPCGHLALCESCSTTAKRCILCNTKIESKLKVYRA